MEEREEGPVRGNLMQEEKLHDLHEEVLGDTSISHQNKWKMH